MPERVGDACVTPPLSRNADVSLAFVKPTTLGIASSLCTNKRRELATAQRLLDIFELSPPPAPSSPSAVLSRNSRERN